MTDFIIISAAFGKRYIEQLNRLKSSVEAHYPGYTFLSWRNEDIPGKPFRESLYGFKVHAVAKAMEAGFKKIIFLDPACILQHAEVDYWFIPDMPPVIAVKDDNVLSKMIGKKALEYYGNPDITGWHLVGGSLYVFDFNKPLCREIYNHWRKAEEDGIFGSQVELASEQINGHRMDESCMAVALYSHGVEPVGHDVARYNQNEDSIIIKRHFK